MTYYMKGESNYDSASHFMWLYLDNNGYPDADYGTRVMETHGETSDPFMAFGVDTGPATWTYGQQQVEIGLLKSYRLKFDTSGVFVWAGPGQDDWDVLTGGTHALDAHSDVVIDGTPGDNEVLAWDTSSGKWINQTTAEAGLATSGHTHGQLHDQSHDNTYHSTNYHTESDGTGVATVHSDITSTGSQSIITTDERNALHTIYQDSAAVSAVNAAGLALASTKVITTANEDLTFTFGRGGIYCVSDYVYFAHRDRLSTSNYALRQSPAGLTNVSGVGTLNLCISNSPKMVMTASALTMSIPIAMGTNKITGLTAGAASGEAVEYDQLHAQSHVLATSGPHSDSLPLTDLASYAAQGDLIFGGVSDWGVLTKGTSGKILTAGATTISWEDAIASPVETDSTFPVSPVDGQLYYDIEDEIVYMYSLNALAWIQIGGGGTGSTGFNPPIGYITMFSGTWTDNVTIPGWYKCDGNNGTVNLVDKFVRGGATSGGTGGSDDLVVPQHNHTATQTAHQHSPKTLKNAAAGSGTWVPNAGGSSSSFIVSNTPTITVNNEGVAVTDKNIPAYYQLIFIQRIS